MIDIFMQLLFNGCTISGAFLMVYEVIESINNHVRVSDGPIYNSEHSIVDFENLTVTYDYLPDKEVQKISNAIGLLISATLTILSFILSCVHNTETHIALLGRIIFTTIFGIIIAAIIILLKKLILTIIIKIMNVYAKRHGIIRHISDGDTVI